MVLAVANDNGRRFGHHCRQRASPNLIKLQARYKWINFCFNLLNLLNRFDGGLGTNMRKADHPSGGMDSSNSRHWRGERLQHHDGDVVCHVVCAFCGVSDSWLVSRTCRTYILEVLQSEPPRLAPYLTKWATQACTIPQDDKLIIYHIGVTILLVFLTKAKNWSIKFTFLPSSVNSN